MWAPCEEEPAAECGKLTVPIDWSAPDGPTVDIAVARRKATDPAARIGSLVINPGGPGGSGVESVYGAPWSYTEELQKRFDIVGFDPRGVGHSNPVICSASVYNQMPHTVMKSQADFDAWNVFTKKLHVDCRERTGPLYDHVDSKDVARDLDALRAALGEEKLTYYGISYGTLIGQMYAELFPTASARSASTATWTTASASRASCPPRRSPSRTPSTSSSAGATRTRTASCTARTCAGSGRACWTRRAAASSSPRAPARR
ncbi:alpha/beta fold hydrolase [Nonomuraea diastatica]|uniref:Alpha/beta fold hydrolase n=1 Tax=Nonomuraea diastatica TaxID=1848329 RepID=A0A4V2YA40_9ACTN|nr:alpha/beta fold hydrolase [Nonomuraea diastatica]TDD02286.1 alpha/beta fold hydrolase [Nonomuraea diastatica]